MEDNKQQQQQSTTDNTQQDAQKKQEQENQQIPYSRFKEVLDRAKKAEETLSELQRKQEETTRLAEEEKAKASGDYSKLVESYKTKESRLKDKIVQSVLIGLGAKHGLNDPADVRLFDAELEVDADTYEIKNLSEVEKAFEDWKKNKSYLFKSADTKPVPKTDNQPQSAKAKADGGQLTTMEKFKKGLQESRGSKP